MCVEKRFQQKIPTSEESCQGRLTLNHWNRFWTLPIYLLEELCFGGHEQAPAALWLTILRRTGGQGIRAGRSLRRSNEGCGQRPVMWSTQPSLMPRAQVGGMAKRVPLESGDLYLAVGQTSSITSRQGGISKLILNCPHPQHRRASARNG